jgi:hypothetical protein
MMKPTRCLFILLLSVMHLAPMVGRAQDVARDGCPESIVNVMVGVVGPDNITNIPTTACKPSRSEPAHTLALLAYEPPGYASQDDFPYLIALIDANLRIAARHRGAIIIQGGTYVSEGSLQLDIARYQLNKNTRAFGIRFNGISTPRCADAGWSSELTLFVREADQLRPVFGPIATGYDVAREGGLCGEGPVDTWKMVLSVAATAHHGFADLVATYQSDTAKTVRCVFKYDGERYATEPCYVAHISVM